MKRLFIGAIIFLLVLLVILPFALVWKIYTWASAQHIGISSIPEWVFLGLFILMPVLGGLFVLWAYRRKYGSLTRLSWLSANEVWLLAGWGFLIFFPLLLGDKGAPDSIRDWWWGKITDPVGMAIIIGFTLFGYMMYHNPLNPFRWKLAWIGVVILVAVSAWHLFGKEWWMAKKAEAAAQAVEATSAYGAKTSRVSSLSRNSATAQAVMQFWREHLPSSDAELMIDIAEKESAFNQFEKDGVTPYRGVVREDVGVMQINEGWWLAQSKQLGYDINTLEGNLQMALWIYQTSGPKSWATYDAVIAERQGAVIVMAPVAPTWSEKIDTHLGVSIDTEGPIKVRNDRGEVRDLDEGQNPSWPASMFDEFQSSSFAPVNVKVTRP